MSYAIRPVGDVVAMGDVVVDGRLVGRVLVVAFATEPEIREAVRRRACEFGLFGEGHEPRLVPPAEGPVGGGGE